MQVEFKTKEHAGKIAPNRKESNFVQELAALIPSKYFDSESFPRAHGLVIARIYRTDSRAYACIWVNAPGLYVSGGGYAGGGGYHRASEAMENAIRDAGIVLSESIGGVGDDELREAFQDF